MRLDLYLGISILLLTALGWGIRLVLRREALVELLFTFAVISYLFHHLTGSRTL